MKKIGLFALVVVIASLLVLSRTTVTTAHENRKIGKYQVAVGWRQEPAYTNVFNGPEIFINELDSNKEVEGAEETLKVEVLFGDKSKKLKLEVAYGEKGHYIADLIPTQPGDYTFHLTGKIGDQAIDEKYTSADGKFTSVEPISDIQFP